MHWGVPLALGVFICAFAVAFMCCCYLGKALRAGISGFELHVKSKSSKSLPVTPSRGNCKKKNRRRSEFYLFFDVTIFFVVILQRRYERGFGDFNSTNPQIPARSAFPN